MSDRPTPSQMRLFTALTAAAYTPRQLDLFPESLPGAEVCRSEEIERPTSRYNHGPERWQGWNPRR